MLKKTIACFLFILGILLLEVHTTFAVLWQLLTGLPNKYPLSSGIILYYAQGFTPIFGALLLLVAGLVYEKLEDPK
jgi:hypothetical protein